MLLLYILWDDQPIFMISGSNEQLQQELEYILLKPDCQSWWISKMQSNGEASVLEFGGMWSHPFIDITPGLFWPRVVISGGSSLWIKKKYLDLFNHSTVSKQMTAVKLLVLDNNTWNHLTVCK